MSPLLSKENSEEESQDPSLCTIDIDTSDPAYDDVFEILKNSRRRAVLEYLNATNESATKGELAEAIAAKENKKPISSLTSQERKRVYVSLYQFHLPKMESAGVIEITNNRQITLTDAAEQCLAYISNESSSLPWPLVYIALSGSAVGVYLLFLLNTISSVLLGVLLGILCIVSILHLLEDS